MNTDADYLWDRTGPVDPEVERLEQTLGALRYRPRATPAAPRRGWLRLAAVVTLAAAGAWLFNPTGPAPAPSMEVRSILGTATIDANPLRATGRLAVGSWLETDPGSQAVVQVDSIGTVTVHGSSRLRLVETRPDTVHRLQLARGRIDAFISAPPKLFLVDTPSALAIDLGCAYTLEVDEAGDGLLAVTLGRVALEHDGLTSTVPMGAVCRLQAGRGPGVPVFLTAPPGLWGAVERFESGDDDASVMADLLREARRRDTLTLWHLLPRTAPGDRARIAERIIDLAGLPPGLDLDRAMTLDRRALDEWFADLELDW